MQLLIGRRVIFRILRHAEMTCGICKSHNTWSSGSHRIVKRTRHAQLRSVIVCYYSATRLSCEMELTSVNMILD